MTKDNALRIATKAQIAINSWRDTAVRRMRSDGGASVVEYAGLVVLIALIVVAVRVLNLQTTIASAIEGAVARITGGGAK